MEVAMSVLIAAKNHAGYLSASKFVREAARSGNMLVSGAQLNAKVLRMRHVDSPKARARRGLGADVP
jgi:hypothetical protein